MKINKYRIELKTETSYLPVHFDLFSTDPGHLASALVQVLKATNNSGISTIKIVNLDTKNVDYYTYRNDGMALVYHGNEINWDFA